MAETSLKTAFARATEAAQFLREKLPSQLQRPRVAIVCGSGLGLLQHALNPTSRVEVPYDQIPGMPRLSVEGHEGKMVFGSFGEDGGSVVPVVLLVGRAHYYEGHSMDLVVFATRVCRCLEVNLIILTNAAGGINPDYKVGDIMLLSDHLNIPGMAGAHPLFGPNEVDFGVRFLPLSDAYDLELRRRVHNSWTSLDASLKGNRTLREGVYAFLTGPTYETRAEARMWHLLGADVVGMSTVPEVITARHSGIRVLAMSLVTNNVVLEAGPRGDDARLQNMSIDELVEELAKGKADHTEVLEAGQDAAHAMKALIVDMVRGLND